MDNVIITLSLVFFGYILLRTVRKRIRRKHPLKLNSEDKPKLNLIEGKVVIPLLSFEPIEYYDKSILSSDNFVEKGFVEYTYTVDKIMGELLDGLFEEITFKVFKKEKEFGEETQINLILKTPDILLLKSDDWKDMESDDIIVTTERIKNFVNLLNEVFFDNDPYTEVDNMRIISKSWRGRMYKVNKNGELNDGLMHIFEQTDHHFTLFIMGYKPYFSLKQRS